MTMPSEGERNQHEEGRPSTVWVIQLLPPPQSPK